MNLTDLLAELPEIDLMSDDDIAAYRDELRAASVAARGERGAPVPSDIGLLLQSAAEVHGQLTVAQQGRAEMAAQLITEADNILDTFAPPVASGSDEPALAAAASSPRRATAVPARYAPRSPQPRNPISMVASGGGAPILDDDALIGQVFEATERLRMSPGADGQKIYVAKLAWDGNHREMVSSSRSSADNGASLSRAAAEFVDQKRQRSTMIASGGIPGPPSPVYTLPTWGSTVRPLRDALPSILAARGEIIFNQSPTIEDIVSDTGSGAIGAVTAAQDLAGATKNVQTIGVPTPKTAVVEADTLRLSHGNFSDRFLPEFTRAWMTNAQTQFARHNESRRFNDIAMASTHFVNTPARFGAWRDLVRCLVGMVAELEDRLRDPGLPITVLMPAYVSAMLVTDLVSQSPGDDAWGVTESMVRARLSALFPTVDFAWVLDGNQARQRLLTTPSGQSPRTAGFDSDVDFLLFATGAWAYLDGGELDLGVIRDSVLSATNAFQTFLEIWEGVAQLGPISYRTTISLCADGVTQAPATINICQPSGS